MEGVGGEFNMVSVKDLNAIKEHIVFREEVNRYENGRIKAGVFYLFVSSILFCVCITLLTLSGLVAFCFAGVAGFLSIICAWSGGIKLE
jgi:hypothetical protein